MYLKEILIISFKQVKACPGKRFHVSEKDLQKRLTPLFRVSFKDFIFNDITLLFLIFTFRTC